MATVDEELKDEGYVRWVQIGTCLSFVKMGLEDFVLQQSQVLQQRVKTIAGAAALCQDAEIEKQKKRGKWKMNCNTSRNCQDCQAFLDELDRLCRAPFQFYYRHFENSNIHLWPVDKMHWNMAKVYMSPDLDPTQQSQNPQDTDLSNLLNFIEHCSVPACAINDHNNVRGVRKCRNEVMHTSSFTVTEADFKSYINSMDLLLNDQTRVAWCDDAQEGALKLKEIRDSQSFTITTDAEFRILRDRALELQKQNKTMMAEVADLKSECEGLEGKDDEQSKTNLAELVHEIEKQQDSLKELESTFKKLNAFASRNKDLKGRLQPFTEMTRTELNVSQHQLNEIRQKYKRDRTDNEPDVFDEATEQYETDEERYEAVKEISRGLVRENNDLKAELKTLKEDAETAASKTSICDARIIELENELQELKSTNTELNNHIKQQDRTIEDMQNEIKKKNSDLQKSKLENEATFTAIGERDSHIRNLKTEVAALNKQLTDKEIEVQHLLDKKAKCDAHINKLQRKMESERKEKDNVINQLKLIEQNYTEAQRDIKCLTEDINALIDVKLRQDGKNSELNNANIEIEAQLHNLELDNENIARNLKNVCDKNKILRNELRVLTSRDKIQSKEILLLLGINQNLDDRVTHLRATIYELRKMLVSAEQVCQNIKNELLILQEDNYNLQETSIRQNDEISELQAEKERNEADAIKLNKEICIKKEMIKLFKRDIDAVAELKNDNDRLRHTDTTLFRICCCAVILYVIVCLCRQWVATYET